MENSSNLWNIISLISIFIYSLIIFHYASKILNNATNSKFMHFFLACVNTFLAFSLPTFIDYFYLSFFAILVLLFIEFLLIAKPPLKQVFFGAVVFSYHIASIVLPVLMTFSLVYGVSPNEILRTPKYNYQLITFSIAILVSAIFILQKFALNRDIARISTSSPYSETHALTTLFIVFYLSVDAYCVVTDLHYPEQAYQIYAISSASLVVFYYLFFYTINFVNLHKYKRESDIAQSNYNYLLTQKKEVIDKLSVDHLTRLYNKKFVLEKLSYFIHESDIEFGLLFLDVNALKYVNDTFGHEKGDDYLKSIAKAIKISTRDEDYPARISGDEFLVITLNVSSPESVEFIANRVQEQIALQPKIADFSPSASIGSLYVTKELKTKGVDEIIELVDTKMRENKVSFYSKKSMQKENK